VSVNGLILHFPPGGTGTYTLDQSCEGNLTFNDSGVHYDIFVRANGREIEMIETDANSVLNGTAEKLHRAKETNTTADNQNRTMKTISLLAAMLVPALFAGPTLAGNQVTLKASWASVETYEVQFPILFVTGNATQLGRYTATYEEQVDIGVNFGSSVGTITLFAANGDSIFAIQTGQGDPTPDDPNIISIVEVSTITGGTGRFTGATGSFTIERLVDETTGISSGSFSGTVSSPGIH
jgi:hypothetical protein